MALCLLGNNFSIIASCLLFAVALSVDDASWVYVSEAGERVCETRRALSRFRTLSRLLLRLHGFMRLREIHLNERVRQTRRVPSRFLTHSRLPLMRLDGSLWMRECVKRGERSLGFARSLVSLSQTTSLIIGMLSCASYRVFVSAEKTLLARFLLFISSRFRERACRFESRL